MSTQAWLIAVAGTVVCFFVLPYVLAVFRLSPDGTEALLLVVLLWAGSWATSRQASTRRDV